MMKICDNNHQYITFYAGDCPLCAAKEEIERWEKSDSNMKLGNEPASPVIEQSALGETIEEMQEK